MTTSSPRTLQQPDRRYGTAPHAPAKTFLLFDPTHIHRHIEPAPFAPDAVIVDVYGCAQREGPGASLAAALKTLTSDIFASGQAWMRIHPVPSPLCATAVSLLAGHLDGLVLPEVESVKDVEVLGEVLADIVPDGRPLPIMPVFETFASLAHARAVAEHPAVMRLGYSAAALCPSADPASPLPLRKSAHQARSVLTSLSVATGLPAPVNGITSDPQDTSALMHDAVLARSAGFGGQCVPMLDLVPDVRALFCDCSTD